MDATTHQAAYLDYNATALVRPEVVEAMAAALAAGGNPSSVHGWGRRARCAVEEARERVARLVGATPEQIVFTSGGTESNNVALSGLGRRRLIVSAVEHGSVLAAALIADPDAVIVAVDGEGVVRLDELDAALAAEAGPCLVSIMMANNETGVLQPIREVVAIARRHGAAVHTDAVQAAGKIPVDFAALGVDLMSLSAHKIGGPQGVGALVVSEDVRLVARTIGGGQERGLRAGTENVAGIVGYGVAAELAQRELQDMVRIERLRDGVERDLAAVAPGAQALGAGAPRLPNTSCFVMPGVSSETQVMALDLAGVAVSAGAACSSGKVARSHVLEAMGVDPSEAERAIRVSLGWGSAPADVERLVGAWRDLYERAGRRPDSPSTA